MKKTFLLELDVDRDGLKGSCGTKFQFIKRCATKLSALAALIVFATSLIASPLPQSGGQQTPPDNTKTNQGDANQDAMTAQKQKMNSADRKMTQQIRASIMHDDSLSTYAHNIKIITRDGKVTLKGPVRSEDEKSNVEAKALAVAGPDNVTDRLTVAPKK